MAKLLLGSTIGGNEIWHRGNQGNGSGLDADKLKGVSWTVGSTAPTSPNINDIWVDTTVLLVKMWNGTAWTLLYKDISSEKAVFKASETTSASINIPHGTSPTSLVNGDIWTTASAIYVRLNGTTRQLAHTTTWTAPSQAEAEAGTATTQRVWTAQRVSQAIKKQAQPMADKALADAKAYVDEQLSNFNPKVNAYKHVLFAEIDNQRFFDISDVFIPETDSLVDVAQNGWSLSANKYEITSGGIYLWEGVSKDTVLSFTILKNVGLKEQHTPFIAGDGMAGYYGKESRIITGNDLFTKIGLTAGTTLVSGDITWLKFSHNYKTLLIADRNIKSSISWDDIQAQDLVKGKPVEINGKLYLCRLITGGNSNPSPVSQTTGEWKLVVDFAPNDADSNWSTIYSWLQDIPSESIDYRRTTYKTRVDALSAFEPFANFNYLGYRPVLELL